VNGDKTAERLEMAAVKEGNHTHAAVDIDWHASQMECLYRWQFVHHYPVILNCRHGDVGSHIGHPGAIFAVFGGDPFIDTVYEQSWW
jgi:hypothetical protein